MRICEPHPVKSSFELYRQNDLEGICNMALRTIVQDGDPILKKKCRPVTNYDARLAQLLDDMRDTLEDAEGYGLAAPQVGVMRRVFVSVDERDLPENGERPEGYKTKFLEFVNPEIIAQEGDVLQ